MKMAIAISILNRVPVMGTEVQSQPLQAQALFK